MNRIRLYKYLVLIGLAAFIVVVFFAMGWKKGIKIDKGGQISDFLTDVGTSLGKILRKGTAFDYTKTREGEKIFRLQAEEITDYEDGTQVLVGVVADLYGRRNTMTLTANNGIYQKKDLTMTIEGDVTLTDERGMRAVTRKATYAEKDGFVRSHAPVDFQKGPLIGRGGVLKYWVKTGRMRLERGVHMHEENDPRLPDSALRARGESLEYHPSQDLIILVGNPGEAERYSEEWLGSVARIDWTQTAGGNNHGRVWAPSFRVHFREELLTELEGLEGCLVELDEKTSEKLPAGSLPPPPIRIRCQSLRATNDPILNQFVRLDFSGNVFGERGTSHFAADSAIYSLTDDILTLDGNAEIADPEQTVHADSIRYDRRAARGQAFGNVQAAVRSGEGASSFFPGNGEGTVYFDSQNARLERDGEWIEFAEGAVARRGEDTLTAERIEIDRAAQRMHAEPFVVTRLIESGSQRTPTIISARSMTYTGGTHTAYYVGGTQMKRGEITLNSDELDVVFASPDAQGEEQIDRVIGRGSVVMDSPGRIGRGDTMIYDVARDEVTLSGKEEIEVQETDTGRTIRGKRLTYSLNQDSLGIYTDDFGRTVSSSSSLTADRTRREQDEADSGETGDDASETDTPPDETPDENLEETVDETLNDTAYETEN